MCPRPHLSFCACKTKWLAPEFIVSMGPSPHLWFLHAKQRLFDQNHKSLWAQTSPMVFCMQNSDFSIRITSLYGSQPSFSDFVCKTATLGSELQVSMGPRYHLIFCCIHFILWVPDFACCFVNAKQRAKIQNDACLLVPAFICCCVHSKQRHLHQNY